MKKTKIVCTLGPASHDVKIIEQLAKSGMNVARLNFSHGTYEDHAILIANIREVSKKLQTPIAILQDLQGPKIRIGKLPPEGIVLKTGDTILFDAGVSEYTKNRIPLDYKELPSFLKPKERILIADGLIETVVEKVEGNTVFAKVTASGTIFSHKGINVPDTTLEIRAFSKKDEEDLLFGVKQGVDFVALSFVRNKKDIQDLETLLARFEKEFSGEEKQPIRIIAKMERKEAVENAESILEVASGIMVARGDLGIEIPAAEVPLVQKRLITLGRKMHKPVIVATQMLDSMQEHIRPTRAEVSDVANAVIDGADAVMLSNETATGKFPVETVKMMASIIEEVEASEFESEKMVQSEGVESSEVAFGEVAQFLSLRRDVKALVVTSLTGHMAKIISSLRPAVPVFAVTPFERVMRQLSLSKGVFGFCVPLQKNVEKLLQDSLSLLKEKGFLKKGDEVILVSGIPGVPGKINRIESKIVF